MFIVKTIPVLLLGICPCLLLAQQVTPHGSFTSKQKKNPDINGLMSSAGREAGWQVRRDDPGLIVLFMSNRKGEASTVKIQYDDDGYMIKPVITASRDHVYNEQVIALDNHIRKAIGMGASEQSPASSSGTGFFDKLNAGLKQTAMALNKVAVDLTTDTNGESKASSRSTTANANLSNYEDVSGESPEVELPDLEWDMETIAVLPVNIVPVDNALAQALTGEVESTLKGTDYFTIVDMKNLNTFLEMKELQATDLFQDNESMAAFGEFIGARLVVGTEVAKLSSRAFAISLKMFDARTSEVICHPPQRTHEGEALKLLRVARRLSMEMAYDYAVSKRDISSQGAQEELLSQ